MATTICKGCGKPVAVYFVCDVELNGEWCSACFDKTPCGQGKHGEGCPTQVFDTGEDLQTTSTAQDRWQS